MRGERSVRIKKNGFGRYIIVQVDNPRRAWSGSRWAPVDPLGFPAGPFQISNFENQERADEYARWFGFTVIGDVNG